MQQTTQTIFTGHFGTIVQVLVIISLTLHIFSFITKLYELERSKKAISTIFKLIKIVEVKFTEANKHVRTPSIQRKIIGMWIEAFLYCLFSAYFWVFSITIMCLFAGSDICGIKAIVSVFLTFSLMILANMFHVAAQKVGQKIKKLNA